MNKFVLCVKSLLKEGRVDKRLATKLAHDSGITDPTTIKESLELAVVLTCREAAAESESLQEAFSRIESIYQNQVILSYRTSQSVMLQQYSTPAPISFLAGCYVKAGIPSNYKVFEPSAGNGLLTIAFVPDRVTVNEIDNLRHRHLTLQPFNQVLKQDATQAFKGFDHTFDGVVTNPPFGTLDSTLLVDEYRINHLDHAMAIRALDCMKDSGRAAIIIGGHTHYDAKGRVQSGKNRIFLSYLYRHYNVDDILNIDGALYSRQGTSFDVRVILISGRKQKPEGFPPLRSNDANPITDFETLFARVNQLISRSKQEPYEMTQAEYLISKNAKGYWAETSAISDHEYSVIKTVSEGMAVQEKVTAHLPVFSLAKAKARALLLLQQQEGI